MILTITPNPAVDETYAFTELEVGETNRADPPVRRAGGKGLNVARVLHAQGFPVAALAPVGGPNGQVFAKELDGSGIPQVLVTVAPETRRSFALVEQLSGRTTVVNEYGGALSEAEWDLIRDRIVDQLDSGVTVLVASGSLPTGADEDFYPWCVRQAAARGIPSIIDTSGPALLAAACAGATVLKPNHHELAAVTGQTELPAGAHQLLELGAKHVYASAGEDGLIHFAAGSNTWHSARLPQPLIGNPTGAGDSVVAAIAAGLFSGDEHSSVILPRAAAWSASAVLMPTAGELHPSHSRLLAQLVLETGN